VKLRVAVGDGGQEVGVGVGVGIGYGFDVLYRFTDWVQTSVFI